MLRRFCCGLLSLIAPTAVAADSMGFAFDCYANASESCYVIASGSLEGGASERFAAFVEEPSNGVEGFQVLLDSSGGSLQDGIALGKQIRARGFHTVVGRYDRDNFDRPIAPADCLSACAYAFLGGNGRRISEGSRLGFHQFGLAGGAALPDAVGLSGGQEISGILLAYLIEMGVDPRLFVLASSTPNAEMLYPTLEQRLDYDVETPRGFGAFALEPYGAGVVAASKRQDQPRIYDAAVQLTAFCRAGSARLLMTVSDAPAEPELDARLELGAGVDARQIAEVSARSGDRVALFEVLLNPAAAQALAKAPEMVLTINAPRVLGGPHWMRRVLTEMDRRTIAAAFRFCI